MASKGAEFEVDGRTVTITSPEREVFKGITKLDVARYLCAVGPQILAALRDRPVTMERWPKGFFEGAVMATRATGSGDAFYSKKAPSFTPAWVQTAEVTYPSGRTARQVAPADLATILWMANLGTLRFHAWPVRAADTDAVDTIRLDLDPQEGTDFADAIPVAHELATILRDAGLTPFVKTSGGRGIHVFAPLEPSSFIDVRHAAIGVGQELHRRLPKQVTYDWWKELRGQRIFLDFNQNARDRLMASAYSIRPVADARVSMPLAWEDLDAADPAQFTVRTAAEELAHRGDPWASWTTDSTAPLGPLLALYDGTEQPYPPEYPKMPGEPPRVQPSRARSE